MVYGSVAWWSLQLESWLGSCPPKLLIQSWYFIHYSNDKNKYVAILPTIPMTKNKFFFHFPLRDGWYVSVVSVEQKYCSQNFGYGITDPDSCHWNVSSDKLGTINLSVHILLWICENMTIEFKPGENYFRTKCRNMLVGCWKISGKSQDVHIWSISP